MLTNFCAAALILGLVGSHENPTREQLAEWIQELAGTEDAQHAQLLSKAWPHARLAVATALARDESPSIRSWCARILGDHEGEIEQRALAHAAQRDGLPRVRAVALQQLSKGHTAIFTDTLRGLLEWESDRAVITTALGLIERLGDASFVEPVLNAVERRFDANLARAGYGSLRKLTGMRLPDDAKLWRKWIEARAQEGEQGSTEESDGDK